MTRTVLTQLIEQQTAASLVTTITRTTDRIVEELTADLLHEPEFREQLRGLVRVAFARALAELSAPPEPERPA